MKIFLRSSGMRKMRNSCSGAMPRMNAVAPNKTSVQPMDEAAMNVTTDDHAGAAMVRSATPATIDRMPAKSEAKRQDMAGILRAVNDRRRRDRARRNRAPLRVAAGRASDRSGSTGLRLLGVGGGLDRLLLRAH